MTPRKLNALVKAHITMNPTGPSTVDKASKKGHIDQIF